MNKKKNPNSYQRASTKRRVLGNFFLAQSEISQKVESNEETTDSKFPSYKDHLNKTFLEELNFRIWSTRGSRFNASKRLNNTASLSNLSLAVVSCYLIMISLFGVYQIITNSKISNVLAFSSTGLSILLLVISQIENAKDYRLRAHLFHNCAIALGSIYGELRIFKTIGEHSTEDKREIAAKLEKKYQLILKDHENHEDIDYDSFRLQHSRYFELTWSKRTMMRLKKYYKTQLIYHFYIFAPLILGLYFILTN